MKHEHATMPRLSDPVWLLFVPPIIGRAWLLWRAEPTYSSPLPDLLSTLLLIIVAVGTWLLATQLAQRARLSARGTERFIVMSTLGILASPLYTALAETLGRPFDEHWSAVIVSGMQSHPVPLALTLARIYTLIIVLTALCLAIISALISSNITRPFFTRIRHLTIIPLLLSIGTVIAIAIFYSIHVQSGILQAAWIVLALALPYLLAALFATPYIYTQCCEERKQQVSMRRIRGYHICMLALLGLYFVSQLYSYGVADLIHP